MTTNAPSRWLVPLKGFCRTHGNRTFVRRQRRFSKSAEIQEEGGAIGENDYINWLKHGSLKRGGPRFEAATISAEESLVVVYRAITKYNAVYDDFSPQMLSYLGWLKVWLETGVNDR